MSERDEFYRQFSRSYDKLHQSEKRDDLVERVTLRDKAVLRHQLNKHAYTDVVDAAIVVALEEAARVVEDPSVVRNAAGHATAIRALIPKERT